MGIYWGWVLGVESRGGLNNFGNNLGVFFIFIDCATSCAGYCAVFD